MNAMINRLPALVLPLSDRIALRQLLQHTSGLPNPDATLVPGSPADAMPAYDLRSFTKGKGWMHELASAAFCEPRQARYGD